MGCAMLQHAMPRKFIQSRVAWLIVLNGTGRGEAYVGVLAKQEKYLLDPKSGVLEFRPGFALIAPFGPYIWGSRFLAPRSRSPQKALTC